MEKHFQWGTLRPTDSSIHSDCRRVLDQKSTGKINFEGININGLVTGASIMQSTSNWGMGVLVNNFSIRSRGMRMTSTGVSQNNGSMEIRFRLQDGDGFQTTQTAGRRIKVRIADRNGTRRRDRWIKIRVPRGVRVGSVTVDQVGGDIVIRINDI